MIWRVLSNLFIYPLRYVIELIFSVLSRLTDNFGLSIIGVSIVVQILVLPLYKSADAVQEKERDKQKSMEKWVTHIKKTFSGNERFMMLSAYYNEQNYKPYHSLKSSISLLLQIPFFIAAYNFLSTLQCLGGVSFLFLKDLLKPDELFSIGGFSINVMPVLMTVINIVSGMIYTRGFPIKEKIQLYGMAAIFLVLLYNSPSGLVLYWTMNNLFSLLKNAFIKLIKNPKRVIRYMLVISGAGITVFTIRQSDFNMMKKLLCFSFAGICFTPQFVFISKRFIKQIERSIGEKENPGRFFLLCALMISLIVGVVIPVSVVSASPEEFIRPAYGPMRLILDTFSVSLGFFLVWGGIFYALAPVRFKRTFVYVYLTIIGFSLVDFFVFGKTTGLISSELVYDNYQYHSYLEIALNGICSALFSIALFIAFKHFRKVLKYFLIILLLSMVILSGVWSVRVVKTAYPLEAKRTNVSDKKVLSLSTEGNNVIVLMLDRAMGSYLPFIVNERPDVAQALAEFTFYPNTLSFGKHTNFASAALFGGYEYTPEEINKRTDMTLVEKQNEALSVMPLLFSENSYEVTVCDPPYAGYLWIPDLSIYDAYPEIKAYNLTGRYSIDETDNEQMEKDHTRRLLSYSLMKCCPLFLSNAVYDDGYYFSVERLNYSFEFKNSVAVLQWLPSITKIKPDDTDCFIMMQNDTPHQATILNYPSYEMSGGDQYEADPGIRVASDGSVLDLNGSVDRAHYHAFAISMILISRWIDFMKENGVWDNTRMVIASDHGVAKENSPRPVKDLEVVGAFNPVLLVKDFCDSTGLHEMSIDYSFMTNADVPTLAVSNIIPNAINPFTGRQINTAEKSSHQQMVTTSGLFDADGSNAKRTQFDTSDGPWYAVADNIFDLDNWHLIE